jgi:hypothetical protein
MEGLAVEASMTAYEVSILTEPERINASAATTAAATTTTTSTTRGPMSGVLQRKVAKRTFPLSLLSLVAAEPLTSLIPIGGDIPVPAKKPRLEVPLVTSPTTEESVSSTKITSFDTTEAALPPSNVSAAGSLSSESSLEIEVELTILRVVKPAPTLQTKHASGKKRRKGELSALAAMVAGIWAADQGKSLETYKGMNSDATGSSAALSTGETKTFHNDVDTSINQATKSIGYKRSSEEDNTLMCAVEEHIHKNWDPVAASDPTKNLCTGRWHGDLDPSIDEETTEYTRTGKWTAAEIKTLNAAVNKYHGRNWDAIASLVQGRTKKQCTNRWYHALEPSVDGMTGRVGTETWTTEDDIKLKDAVEKHGYENWDAIAALLPARTKIQCWSRWHAAVDPRIDRTTPRTGRWTKDEDNKLRMAAIKYGGKNWDAVAAMIPSRTKSQCTGRWHDALDPSIQTGRTGKWTPDEDKTLKDAVEKHGGRNFEAIASLVQGRTKKQCTNRWYNALDPSVERVISGRTHTWTKCEDNKLKDAVEKYGDENWDAISALFAARTKIQCRSRWYDVVDPRIDRTTPRTGRWTQDEDDNLKEAAEKYGGQNWEEISMLVPSRTQKQCRDRWRNALSPSIDMAMARTGHWTAEEDIKLKQAVQKYGGKNWTAIAAMVPDRRSTQCWGRWHSALDPSIDSPRNHAEECIIDKR